MELDVKTMFVVTITVTAILGLLLVYAWNQNRRIPSLAWWGGAHIVACAAAGLIGARGAVSDFWSIEIANALLFVSAGMTWAGARLFDHNRISIIGVFGGAAAWIVAARLTNFLALPPLPVVTSSMIIAAYTFAAGSEFWRGRDENLRSRLPLVVLLYSHGVLYLVRVLLAIFVPGGKAEIFLSTAWFGSIGLESLLYMVATAFILLAMAKERTELEHKVAATVDSLTGVANRRAFLESAVSGLRQRSRSQQPVSALLFDLDRFKSINDRYGHSIGDRVLRNFADIAKTELRSTDLLGRLGGEEFGVLLYGAEASSAIATAERIRETFAAGYQEASGYPAVSVSVGVASVLGDQPTDVETLLARADEALYVAKARGRNRVELADGYADFRPDGARSGRDMRSTSSAQPWPWAGEAVLQPVASPAIAPRLEERASEILRGPAGR
jgi:diguanylate cyclase (GGDEF)-like protein